jgi:hypothetical protein
MVMIGTDGKVAAHQIGFNEAAKLDRHYFQRPVSENDRAAFDGGFRPFRGRQPGTGIVTASSKHLSADQPLVCASGQSTSMIPPSG